MVGFVLAGFYLLLYFITGSIITARMKKEYFSLTLTCIVGFFFYYLLFTIVALPMKLTLQPLSRLTCVWSVCLVCIVILSMILNLKRWSKWLCCHPFKNHYAVFFGVILLVLFQILIIHHNAGIGSALDAAYYIGEVNSSVATNTISQYDSFTGCKLAQLHPSYMLVTYQTHSMVMCQLFGVHPLIEMRTSMMTVVIILFHMCLYKVITGVFQKVNIGAWIALGIVDMVLWLDDSQFTPTGFYVYRTFEGKTVLAVVVITAMLYFFIRVVQDVDNSWNWSFLLLIVLTSFIFAMSGMFLVPTFLSTALLGLALSRRDREVFLRMIMLMIPCVALIFCYLLISKDIWIVRIPA